MHFRKQSILGLSVFYQRSIKVTIIICSDSRAHNAARILHNIAGNREKRAFPKLKKKEEEKKNFIPECQKFQRLYPL